MTSSDEHAAMGYLFIEEHLKHLEASGRSPRTVDARADVLHRLHNHLPYGIAFTDIGQIESWFAAHAWSQWTIATYRRHISRFYDWGELAGILAGNPINNMARIRRPRCMPDPVTDLELHQALKGSDDPWHTAIALAAFEGLRVSEIAALDREDITEHMLLVRHGKGDQPGAVPTHPYIWQLVCDRPPGRLVAHRGEPVDGRWLSAHARHHFDRLGLPRVHMHRFRDHFATAMLNAGASLRTVQECLRHASVTSTQGYTLVTDEQRRQAVAALPVPLLEGPEPGSSRLGTGNHVNPHA